MNASSMYIEYKVNVSENQVDTLKNAIRLKKGVTLCFPKGGIRGDHVLLLTPVQINRLDKAQVQGRRSQIRMSARQVVKNVSYTGGFLGIGITHSSCYTTPARALLVYFLVVLIKRLVEMDSISTNMINAIEYRDL